MKTQALIETAIRVLSLSDCELIKELAGKSGAHVIGCNVKRATFSGEAVLKFNLHGDANAQCIHTEAVKHNELFRIAPQFANRYVPSLIASETIDGTTVSMYDVAGLTLQSVRTLASLEGSEAMQALQAVAALLIEGIDIGLEVGDRTETAQAILKTWLDYRLEPKKGRIYDYFQEELRIDPLISNLSLGSRMLPNPYAFAVREDGSSLPTYNLRPIRGYAHGDLHGDNILMDRFLMDRSLANTRRPMLKIIDFAEARLTWPIFFDHAHLELNEILRHCENLDISRWLEFLDTLSKIFHLSDLRSCRPSSPYMRSAFEAAAAIRHALTHSLKRSPTLPHADLSGQVILSRIAVGLIFLHKKGISAENRKKALAYASSSLSDFVSLYSLSWPSDAQSISFGGLPPANTIDSQAIWEACGMFDSHRYAYVLAISETTRADSWEVQQIVRLPWAMVLDLNPETAINGFLTMVSGQEAATRIINRRLPHNEPARDFGRSICWILASGDSRTGGGVISKRDWQRHFRRSVETHLAALHRATSPKPVRLVIVAGERDDDKIATLWESIDAIFADALATVLLTKSNAISSAFQEDVMRFSLGMTEFATAVHHVRGEPSALEDVRLPVRVPRTDGILDRTLRPFRAADLQSLEETLEIVHEGLAWRNNEREHDSQLFYRGGIISWRDLEDHLDVVRDVATSIKDEIGGKPLETYRVSRCQVEHAPGAGGTTVARRAAWDLKEKFPVVIVRKPDDAVEVSRSLNKLFELTNLPVVAVVEMSSSRATEDDVVRLVGELKSFHTRVVLITVKRVPSPRNMPQVFPLRRPMGYAEQRKFFEIYKRHCSQKALEHLRALSEDNRLESYRVPFFYGLFVFEERFHGVREYVGYHLMDLPKGAHKALLLVAIVSAYAQSAVPVTVMLGALGKAADEAFDPEETVGREAQRLLLFGEEGVRVVHPVIADEALEILLGSEWKYRLADTVVELIDLVADVCGPDSEQGRQLLADILIRREPWPDIYGQEKLRSFSELLLDIASDASKSQVLKRLTERFPSEPHFWNHRGRFASMEDSNYPLAIECLEKATSLAEEDPLHWHSLGMVHRYEVRRRLQNLRGGSDQSLEKAVEGHSHVQEAFDRAAASFEKARNVAPEDEYGYITHIQIIEETIRALDSLAGASDAMLLLKDQSLGGWCRQQLQLAEWLMWSARILSAHRDEPSARLLRLEGSVKALYGRFDEVIEYFEDALNEPIRQEEAIYVRRALVSAYFARDDRSWEKLNERHISRIFELTSQNLYEGRASSWDIRYWFHAYRRLHSFDLMDAMSKLERLTAIDPSLEAYYYLYVVRFLEWFTCHTTDVSGIKATETKCKELSGKFQRSFPFEWVARQPKECPVVHRSALGEWRREGDADFFVDTSRLWRIRGVISNLAGAPRTGEITFVPPCATPSARYQAMKAFFVPRGDFSPRTDLNVNVEFFLGISYEGLRAFSVARAVD